MKKIIFVRHAKAEDPASGISDYERSLTLKGKIISRLMAKKLREKEKSRLTFISSPAFRALETALVFAAETGVDAEKIIIDSNLYFRMSMKHLPGILKHAGEEADNVIMFGHNPSFSEVANGLCKEGCEFMPKTGIIGISFDADSWSAIKQKTGTLEYYLIPDKVL